METPTGVLTCDMDRHCKGTITHIDNKGYLYCAHHGEQRKSVRPCRRMTAKEILAIRRGEALVEY